MANKWFNLSKINSIILPYTTYIVLILLLLDTIINRVFYFFARYTGLSDFFNLAFLVRLGRFAFIFGDLTVIILLSLLVITILRKKHTIEYYIAFPMIILLAANILRFFLRSTIELDILTTQLNISSILILVLAVIARIRKSEFKINFLKRIIPLYLILLTLILLFQHIHQLNIIIFNSEMITNSVLQNAVLYLLLIESFLVSAYAFSVSGKELSKQFLKPTGIYVMIILFSLIIGTLSVILLKPQVLPNMVTLVFGVTPQLLVNQLILIGFIFFISTCGVLWLDKGGTGLYRQEAVGLLMIAVAVFFFGSIYYYPRVAIGIVLITIPMFKKKIKI